MTPQFSIGTCRACLRPDMLLYSDAVCEACADERGPCIDCGKPGRIVTPRFDDARERREHERTRCPEHEAQADALGALDG